MTARLIRWTAIISLLAAGATSCGSSESADRPTTTTASSCGPSGRTVSSSEEVRSRLSVDDMPVEGVCVFAVNADTRETVQDRSAADGLVFLPLPGPGDYEVSLVDSSLPDGVTLRSSDRRLLQFSVQPGQSRVVLFPLEAASG